MTILGFYTSVTYTYIIYFFGFFTDDPSILHSIEWRDDRQRIGKDVEI